MFNDQPLVYAGERYSFDQWLISEHSGTCAPLRIDGDHISVKYGAHSHAINIVCDVMILFTCSRYDREDLTNKCP